MLGVVANQGQVILQQGIYLLQDQVLVVPLGSPGVDESDPF
jgi:hypothetical protein